MTAKSGLAHDIYVLERSAPVSDDTNKMKLARVYGSDHRLRPFSVELPGIEPMLYRCFSA